MKFSVAPLVAAAGMASAAVMDKSASSPMSVSLTPMGNHMVKATITNTGNKALNVFNRGTLLDENTPTDKLHISNKSKKAKFHGIYIKPDMKNIPEENFTPFAAGESKEIMINMAETYHFEETAAYDVVAKGAFHYAEAGSNKLAKGRMAYAASPLNMHVDTAITSKIAKVVDARIAKRATTNKDCTADQKATVAKGYQGCYDQATAAANAALNGSASKFKEYFKSTAQKDRQYVHDRYTAVAKECKNSPGGVLDVYCVDHNNECRRGDFAYTYSSDDTVTWCSSYYSASLESSTCHADDKVGTTIHEFTHAADVFSPSTGDYAYGYDNCYALSYDEAIENADTYEYYANGMSISPDFIHSYANTFYSYLRRLLN